MADVVVIGAGITGLTLTERLQQAFSKRNRGESVICLEASDRAGGHLRSDIVDGYLCEWGPSGFLDNAPATLELVDRLGLGEDVLVADDVSARRYIFRNGRLRELPSKPPALLTSGVLPLTGLLRIFLEPLIKARRHGTEESIYEFVRRRFGKHAATILADAMVSGVFAGDTRRLSLSACLPMVQEMEIEHGGIIKAMARRRGSKSPTRQRSFRQGMEQLARGLQRRLGPALKLESAVDTVAGLGARGYRIVPQSGVPIEAGVVALTTPAPVTSRLLGQDLPQLTSGLASVPYASMVVIHLGYHRSAIGDLPQGFGFLVPRNSGIRILGSIWTDQVFPEHANDGRCLLRVMIGGAHDPEAHDLDDAELLRIARREIMTTMGIEAAPVFNQIHRHRQAIPQYTLGHKKRLAEWETILSQRPGMHLAGSSYRGVSVNDCIVDGERVASRILQAMEEPS